MAARGGRTTIETITLLRATVEGFPPGVTGFICTSDPQRGAPSGGDEMTATQMLGKVVAEELAVPAQMGRCNPARSGAPVRWDQESPPRCRKKKPGLRNPGSMTQSSQHCKIAVRLHVYAHDEQRWKGRSLGVR